MHNNAFYKKGVCKMELLFPAVMFFSSAFCFCLVSFIIGHIYAENRAEKKLTKNIFDIRDGARTVKVNLTYRNKILIKWEVSE